MTRFYCQLLGFVLLSVFLSNTHFASAQTAMSTQEVKFKDFFRWPIGPNGLEFTDALLRVDNQRVHILGYMVGQEKNPVGQFLLTPLPLRTSEDADGDADDLPASTLAVLLPAPDIRRAVAYRPGLIKLSGIIKTGRHELPDGRIVWVRLLLDDTTP
jgi:hypothetical protein